MDPSVPGSRSLLMFFFILNSPSLPSGLLAAAAKHLGQETVKSTECSGIPSLNLVAGSWQFFDLMLAKVFVWILFLKPFFFLI